MLMELFAAAPIAGFFTLALIGHVELFRAVCFRPQGSASDHA
jgi:hypothetical protein